MNLFFDKGVDDDPHLVGAVKDEAVLPADDGPRDGAVGQGEVGLEPAGTDDTVVASATERLQPGGQLNSVAEVEHVVVLLCGTVGEKSGKMAKV